MISNVKRATLSRSAVVVLASALGLAAIGSAEATEATATGSHFYEPNGQAQPYAASGAAAYPLYAISGRSAPSGTCTGSFIERRYHIC